LALYNIHGPHDHGHVHVYVYVYVYVYGYVYVHVHGHVHVYSHVHVYVHNHDYSILLIRVDRFNPAKTSESSNSRPKGFSVARGQGDPWSIEYLNRGDPVFKVIKDSRVSKASLYKIREKAITSRWVPGIPIELRHIDDRPRSGRPRVSIYITAAILTILTRNSTTRGYSCRLIAQEVSSHLPGK
jgi:hypothetical protein